MIVSRLKRRIANAQCQKVRVNKNEKNNSLAIGNDFSGCIIYTRCANSVVLFLMSYEGAMLENAVDVCVVF